MTIRSDLSALDHKYRAKRTGQTPAEYAECIHHFKRPLRLWPAALGAVTAILLLAAAALKVLP